MIPLALGVAGANLLGQGLNALFQSNSNKAAEQFQMRMYDRQRSDALSDWDRQNAYNSPAAQMQRFKDAGLSPHLIYNQQTQSPSVRSSSGASAPRQAPAIDLGGVMGQFMQVMLQQNQLSIQEKAIALQEKKIEAADLGNKLAQQRYVQLEKTNPVSLNLTKEELRNKQMQTVTGYNRDNREWTSIALKQDLTNAQINHINNQVNYIKEQIKSQPILRQKMLAEIGRIAHQNDLTDHQVAMIQEQLGLVESKRYRSDAELDFINMRNEWYRQGLTKPAQQQILDWFGKINPFK